MIYGAFAELYDELFDPELYPKWVAFVKANVASASNVLDVACGTGRMAVELAQAGYQVAGFDLSNEMLALANQRALTAGIDLPLIQGNMLDLTEMERFAAITCFDDSICYLQDADQVATFFQQAYAHLDAGGHFLFDMITPYQTDVVYPGYMYNYHDETRAFMWQSYEGEFEHSVEHDLTFFNYNPETDAYDEMDELHHERTYDLAVYQRALTAAGFKNVTVSADFGNQPIDDKTTRWFFVAEKPSAPC